MSITVGIQGLGYVEQRSIGNLPIDGVRFIRSYDLFNIANFLFRRLFRSSVATSFVNCIHCDLGANRADLLHLVNAMSCSGTPWVVTFEHYLPRWNPRSAFGMRLLGRPSCRKIIAMSRFARDSQLSLVNPASTLAGEIERRLCILHPAQDPLVDSYEQKPLHDDLLTCTFVGRDFFRKGGKEVVGAVAQLIAEHVPIRLYVVSELAWGDYATHSTKEDADAARAMIQSLAPHVQLYEDLPNDDVLDLFKKSHIALLPTYDDTYGFSVLEAQAAGTPVLSTDVCALPEINSDETGWVIPLRKDRHGQAIRATVHDRQQVSERIREGVYSILKESAADRAGIRRKGIRSLQRIREEHSPVVYAKKLQTIYQEAIGM